MSYQANKNKVGSLVRKHAKEKLGYDDELKIPKDFLTQKIGGGRIIKSKTIQKCDSVFAFVHSGIGLPSVKFAEQINIKNTKKTAKLIFRNYDLGTPSIASRLLKKTKVTNKSAFIYYDLARVTGDPNRLRRKDQFPEQQFRGETLFTKNTDKNTLRKTYIDPFFEGIIDFIQKNSPKLIFWVHTYDEYGGGKATTTDNSKGKRPMGMIFQKYKFDKEAFGRYKSQDKSANFNFLDDKQISLIQAIAKKHFSREKYIKREKLEFPVDYPYQSPIMLPGLVKVDFPSISQVIMEFRKDLLQKKHLNAVINSIIETNKKISNT